jgi:kynurenine formamidase
MRVTDPAFAGWHPPAYTVSAEGKVSDAKPEDPNNWGRWGADAQIGTANLATDEAVLAAARLIRTGRRFSLAVPVGTDVPSFRPPPLHLFTSTAGDGVLGDAGAVVEGPGGRSVCAFSDDVLIISLQYTTQLDGLGLSVDDAMYNGYWAGLVSARSGARRLGMHHRARGIVGRGVLLDVAAHRSERALPHQFRIDSALLDATARAQRVEIRPGDVVLVRTGFLGEWLTAGGHPAVEAAPGLSATTIPWLHEHDVMLAGMDTAAIEVTGDCEPGQRPNEFHLRALRDLGLQLGETFLLDALAADCRDDGVFEFFFVAAPLPVIGGAGSPLNPIAIK